MVTNWLITGGCGFIGCNLVGELVRVGEHRIRVLDNLSVGRDADLKAVCDLDVKHEEEVAASPFDWHDGVELITGDILDPDLTMRATKGADVVVHLAANTGVPLSMTAPLMDCRCNVMGTLNCLEAARANDVRRFVFASSGAPLGECETPIHEKVLPRPVSPYGASKLAGETYSSVYFHAFGLETITLRFSNVYGPLSRHKSSVVAEFIRKAVSGEDLEIFGDGGQTRDFIYVADLIGAIRRAAETDSISGELFQVATARETSIKQLTHKLIEAARKAGFNKDIRVKNKAPRAGDVRHNVADIGKAKQMLGWQPVVPLEEGLQKTVGWFLSTDNENLK
jgi:UDP-glucose 4-epimerase